MYSHKMNKNRFNELITIGCYKYEGNRRFFDNLNIRTCVDSSIILGNLKKEGVDILDPEAIILNLTNKKDYNGGNSIDLIKINQYLKQAQETWSQSYFDRALRIEKMKVLFEKYFNATGDFMKTITLK